MGNGVSIKVFVCVVTDTLGFAGLRGKGAICTGESMGTTGMVCTGDLMGTTGKELRNERVERTPRSPYPISRVIVDVCVPLVEHYEILTRV